MLIVMDKSTHEENLYRPSQTNTKQFDIAVTVLTGYKGTFNVTNKNNKLYFTTSINDDEFNIITVPAGTYAFESLNYEIRRIIIKEGYFTEESQAFVTKPNFSTFGSIVEIKPIFIGSQNSFIHINSIKRDLLRFDSVVIYEKYNSTPKPADILSFDNIFHETDIAQGMISKSKRSGIIHNFTMDVDTGYKYIEKFRGGLQ